MNERISNPASDQEPMELPEPISQLDDQENHEGDSVEDDKWANPNVRRKAMDHALQRGTTEELMGLFDDGIDINQEDFQGRTALMLSVASGKEEVVELLLEHGADVNHVYMFQDRVPMTALDAALQTNRQELANLLRAHGAKTGREQMQTQ